jgi:polysaccharide biosynthesis/export protein
VYVTGLTIEEAKAAMEKKLSESFVDPKVAVDVYSYQSKVYYVITQEPGFGDFMRRMSITGNDTVLDAIAVYQSSVKKMDPIKAITVARPKSASSEREILEVRWKDVLHGDNTTNYQILPGDRIFVEFEQPSGGVGGGGAIGRGGPATEPSHSATKPTKP